MMFVSSEKLVMSFETGNNGVFGRTVSPRIFRIFDTEAHHDRVYDHGS